MQKPAQNWLTRGPATMFAGRNVWLKRDELWRGRARRPKLSDVRCWHGPEDGAHGAECR